MAVIRRNKPKNHFHIDPFFANQDIDFNGTENTSPVTEEKAAPERNAAETKAKTCEVTSTEEEHAPTYPDDSSESDDAARMKKIDDILNNLSPKPHVTYADKLVSFEKPLRRYQNTPISDTEFEAGINAAMVITLYDGKEFVSHYIVHCNSGYASLTASSGAAQAHWIADDFEFLNVCADRNGVTYADIKKNGKKIRVPMESFLKSKLPSMINYNIAVNSNPSDLSAFSEYCTRVLAEFKIIDTRLSKGFSQDTSGNLIWNGVRSDPPVLAYKLALPSEKAYMNKFNDLVTTSGLQFAVSCGCAAVLLAYHSMQFGMPVSSFGVSFVGVSSSGKSTALRLVSSLFSSSATDDIFTPFYGTNNALLKKLDGRFGVPICYDEGTINNQCKKSKRHPTTASLPNPTKKPKIHKRALPPYRRRGSNHTTCIQAFDSVSMVCRYSGYNTIPFTSYRQFLCE